MLPAYRHLAQPADEAPATPAALFRAFLRMEKTHGIPFQRAFAALDLQMRAEFQRREEVPAQRRPAVLAAHEMFR